MAREKPILLATSEYEYLRTQMLASRRFESGQLARSLDKEGTPSLADVPFADGERYHRLMESVADREVYLLGGTINDRATMELLDIGMGVVMHGASRLKICIPYFGYQTMERAIQRREFVKAKMRAMQISAIPRAGSSNWVYMVDLHSEGVEHYFEGGVITRHIYAKPLIIKAVEDAARGWQTKQRAASDGSTDQSEAKTVMRVRTLDKAARPGKALTNAQNFPLVDFTVASTDAGRAKWVESLCRDMVKLKLPVHPAFIIKRRISGSVTAVADISADVAGKLVVIYDDMIRTGGSAIAAARAYLAKGALAVILISTHGVLPNDSKERLRASGCFDHVIVTDTHPRAIELADTFLRVIPTGKLLVEKLFCKE